jgi:hypothetical protein
VNFSLEADELDGFDTIPAAATTQTLTTSLSWDNAKPIAIGDGLDRIKPDTGKVVRFALIPGVAPEMALTHFVALQGKSARSYLCSGAGCPICASGDSPRKAIVALAVQYLNADPTTAKLPEGVAPEYKIGYLSLTATTFNLVLQAAPEGSRATDIDFAQTFDGRRYNYRLLAPTARYVKLGDKDKVAALAAPFAPKLRNKLGSAVPAGAAIMRTPDEVEL